MSEQKFEPKVLESQGRSIDEAIFKVIQEMGLSIDEVRIETIQEGSKGLLGLGSKPFVVRLTQRNPEEFEEPDPTPAPRPRSSGGYPRSDQRPQRDDRPYRDRPYQERSHQDRPYQERSHQDRPYQERSHQDRPYQPRDNNYRNNRSQGGYNRGGYNQGGQGGQGGYQRSNNYQRDRGPRQGGYNNQRRDSYRNDYRERPRYEDNLPPLPSVSRVTQPVEYKTYVPGESQVLGADFLLGMLERMGVRATLEYYQDEESIKFRIQSNSMGILIGHRGETLDALQYLTSLVINKELEGYTHVMLDTEGYRSKREESLIRLARKMASQVVATGRNAELEPMNPYERRVLHAALQDYPGVTTFSEGDEGDRHVIITVDDSKTSATDADKASQESETNQENE